MTPSIPALRAALAASSGQFPWTADQNLVFDADGHPVAEPCQRAHEDEDARLIALAVNALSWTLDRLEKLERVADAVEPLADYARKRKASPLRGLGKSVHRIHASTEHEAEITTDHLDVLLSALADLDGGKPS